MSHRCTTYAVEMLRQDPTLPSGARTVFLCVAAAANARTSTTYTGEWLEEASGLGRSQVWRAFTLLTGRGYVSLKHRPGRASVVGFPVFGFIGEATPPTGRVDDAGVWHPSICGCPWCTEATG